MTNDRSINVLALVKNEERYVFLYDEAHADLALEIIGRFAGNPDLSFTWYDAAMLSQKVKAVSDKAANAVAQLPKTNRFGAIT